MAWASERRRASRSSQQHPWGRWTGLGDIKVPSRAENKPGVPSCHALSPQLPPVNFGRPHLQVCPYLSPPRRAKQSQSTHGQRPYLSPGTLGGETSSPSEQGLEGRGDKGVPSQLWWVPGGGTGNREQLCRCLCRKAMLGAGTWPPFLLFNVVFISPVTPE